MNILFLGTPEDKPYLFSLKEAIGIGHTCRVLLESMDMLSEVAMFVKGKDITHIITTQGKLIPKLSRTASQKEQTVQNYAGSWLEDKEHGLVYLIVPPLKQTQTLTYGQFLLNRYVSKITKPGNWLVPDEFKWNLVEGSLYDRLYENLSSPAVYLVAIDTETRKDLSISCISYTLLTSLQTTQTYVVPLPYGLSIQEYEYRYTWIAKYNATSVPKLLQGGKYDVAYLNRYGCPLEGYLFDTMVAHHCWYSELKKDLGTLAAFYIRKAVFWKNEGDTGNEWDLYNYNAMDTWNTAWVFLGWLHEVPDWAINNYLQEFPVIHPCVLSEATGLKVNMESFLKIKKKQQGIVEKELQELGECTVPGYNPGSPKQTKQLLAIIGCKDIKSTEEKDLKKAAYRHPYNQWLIDKIFKYRKAAKLVSTYLKEEKFFLGVLLYSLAPYGTKTGRLASEEHMFWCGLQIQNIPRKGGIKNFVEAYKGFLIGEADYAQAESRCTGYITGDTVLIDAVTGDNDFHSFNASAFFGIPYEEICINLPGGQHKILDNEIRQLSKPVNHGKNYNMGDEVLVDTMGLDNIFKAARRLGLPKHYTAKMIAAYLGKCFDNTYKVVTGDYPIWVKKTVEEVGAFVSATGWTRWCFGKPSKNKRDLNAYIAHPPQNLNAMNLNKAYVRVFNEVWKAHPKDFKLCAQIHDSILFQYREGYEFLAYQVKAIMEESATLEVEDIKGVKRRMSIPVDLSIGGKSWQDSKDLH